MRFFAVALALCVSMVLAAPVAEQNAARHFDEDETGWFVAIPNLMSGAPADA
ncbi:hypothetical protein AURDEDRAFT_167339 [Auricularia subglabra TFB-10046 SS5]|nr:hypothetical protein AURDEDRAFT_167339 [Auricularia subglabra TFB-10046 SS5]